ncbi:MAG: IMP dehydrogenase [Nanoarchaeota archaeon]|nr:IMP dehydrogenase [Nanoarchaeota archaeon]MBU1027626.1 IMP dehydrogenase [Nanoarchaeota archaeon]
MEQGIGLTFDDVSLSPGMSEVVPRDINLETKLTRNLSMNLPFISADMDSVTGPKMAEAIARQGGIGFLWKAPIDDQEKWVMNVKYALNALIDQPVTISPDKTKQDYLNILPKYDRRFSTLVVVDDNNKVLGLVKRDKAKYAKLDDLVSNFMIKNPLKLEKDLGVNGTYDFMIKQKESKVVLVKHDNTLKGLYCFNDLQSIVEGDEPFNRDDNGQLRVGANIGVCTKNNREEFDERIYKLLKKNCDILLVGTAHGHSRNVIDTIKYLNGLKKDFEFDVVAGNVATYDGTLALIEAGADAVKVGLGPGSICTTRIITGAGVSQMTAIYDSVLASRKYAKEHNKLSIPIIADGGIRYSGDVTKALGAGAHSVMIGSLFAAAEESPGEVFIFKGQRYKSYRGMGSEGALRLFGGERYQNQDREKSVPEGIEGRVSVKGNVEYILKHLKGGLKSGMGYVGAANIEELHNKAKFIRPTLASVQEAHPHDVEMTQEAPNYSPHKDDSFE